MEIKPEALPSINIHVVPEDVEVEITPSLGMNVVAVKGDYNEKDLIADVKQVITNAILRGSATNAFRLRNKYVSPKFEYEGFGVLGEHFSTPGKATSHEVEFLNDLANATNIQMYMIFIMFVVRVWFWKCPPNLDAGMRKQYRTLNHIFQNDVMFEMWNSNVKDFKQDSEDEYTCVASNTTMKLTYGTNGAEEGKPLDAMKLFGEMLGVGREEVNVIRY